MVGWGQKQECGDTGSCRSLCVQMPRLKGEFENWVAEVLVGRPPPKFPPPGLPLWVSQRPSRSTLLSLPLKGL